MTVVTVIVLCVVSGVVVITGVCLRVRHAWRRGDIERGI